MSTINENERFYDSMESSDIARDDELSQDELGDVAGGAVRSDPSDKRADRAVFEPDRAVFEPDKRSDPTESAAGSEKAAF